MSPDDNVGFTNIGDEKLDFVASFRTKPLVTYDRRSSGEHERKKILAKCTTMSFEDLSEKGATPFSPKFRELLVQHRSGNLEPSRRYTSINDYVIDPSTTWKVCWDIFVGSNILYSAIVVPFRLGFHVTITPMWLYAEVSVDVVFFVDMILSFLTSYTDNGEKIKSIDQIALHYLKTWFTLDLVSTVPFYLIGDSSSLKTLKLVRIFRLFRLLKLIRLVRLNHKLSNAKASGHITLVFYELSTVLIVTLFLSHLFSCLFYSFSACDESTKEDEYTWEQCGSLDNMYSQYLLSFYWTLSTVLKVGYGDVVLVSDSGRLYSIAVMFMGSIITGYILAVMLKQAETSNPLVTEKTRRMAEMGVYLREKQVPRKIMQRLWKHFEYYYAQLTTLHEPHDLSTTPPYLRLELFNVMRSDVVKLKMFHQDFLLFSELQRHFHPFLAESGEVIVNEDDYCADIFFVIHGCVHGVKRAKQASILADDFETLVGVWTDGGHFGIGTAMLLEEKYWATHRSKSVTDMVWLDLSALCLSPGTVALLKTAAQKEVDNHIMIQSQLKNLQFDGNGTSHTPLMIFNDKVLSSEGKKEKALVKGFTKLFPRSLATSLSASSSSSSSWSTSKLSDMARTVHEELTFRVVRLTGNIIEGRREYEVGLETTTEMLLRGVINPHSKMKMYSDLFISVCTIVSVFTLPLRFGFSIPDSHGWVMHDMILEVAFLMDMVMGFFTAYERPDFLLNTEHKFIAYNYVKSWFVFDLLAGFPFSLLHMDGQLGLLKLFKLVRLIRVMRILKILKVSRLLKALKLSKLSASKFTTPFTSFENVAMRFIRCIVIVVIVTHFAACGWAKLEVMRSDGKDWSNEHNAPVQNDLSSKYIAALYWAVTTATGTGYGDMVAQNDRERFYGMMFMVGGVCTMVYLVGQVANTEKDESYENGNQKVETVRAYLSEQALPEGLKVAVLKHFAYNTSVRSEFNEVLMWRRMPFMVRINIAMASHQKVLKTFPEMFPSEVPTLAFMLLKYLEPSFAVKGTYVFTFETGSAGVYLLLSGEGEIVDEMQDKTETILGNIVAGQKFGVEAFLHDAITFLGVRAVQDMSMYVMTLTGLSNLVAENPLASQELVKKIQSGSHTLTTSHFVGDIQQKRKQLKRTMAVRKHGMETALMNVATWIMEDDESPSDIAHHRCIKSNTMGDAAPFDDLSDLLEAINKNSPSLSLSYEGRKKFVRMKLKMWSASNDEKS